MGSQMVTVVSGPNQGVHGSFNDGLEGESRRTA